MSSEVIVVGEKFSKTPAGRYNTDGPYSGARFRDELLVPALMRGSEVTVDLSGVIGYGSSFLEEAFGGLVRLHKFDKGDLATRLHIIASDPRKQCYVSRVERYMREAWL